MVLAVVHLGGQVDHGIAGEQPAVECLLDALVNRRDELPGDRTTLDRVDELITRPTRSRMELDEGDAELAAST